MAPARAHHGVSAAATTRAPETPRPLVSKLLGHVAAVVVVHREPGAPGERRARRHGARWDMPRLSDAPGARRRARDGPRGVIDDIPPARAPSRRRARADRSGDDAHDAYDASGSARPGGPSSSAEEAEAAARRPSGGRRSTR